MTKTVIFSPVRQYASILDLFLDRISHLEIHNDYEIWFYDDNDDPESKKRLITFANVHSNVAILPSIHFPHNSYLKDDDKHHWDDSLLEKITTIKNTTIDLFLKSQSDELFLVDSDLILHPKTLLQLQSANVPIISEVFWTKFSKDKDYHPNVWDCHFYKFWSADSMIRLKNPGIYEVGGLGACTLIQREPLEKGVNFRRVQNTEFWGEDRHFCIRAVCLGYSLFADTHYPPFHVYRNSMLDEAVSWAQNGCSPEYFKQWLNPDWEKQVRLSFLPKRKKLIPRILRRLALMLD